MAQPCLLFRQFYAVAASAAVSSRLCDEADRGESGCSCDRGIRGSFPDPCSHLGEDTEPQIAPVGSVFIGLPTCMWKVSAADMQGLSF